MLLLLLHMVTVSDSGDTVECGAVPWWCREGGVHPGPVLLLHTTLGTPSSRRLQTDADHAGPLTTVYRRDTLGSDLSYSLGEPPLPVNPALVCDGSSGGTSGWEGGVKDDSG